MRFQTSSTCLHKTYLTPQKRRCHDILQSACAVHHVDRTYHTTSPLPDLKPPKPTHSCLDALPTIQLRSDIQVKVEPLPRLRTRLRLPRIEINHILDLGPAPIHNPVVSVERHLVPQESIPPRPRRQACAQPAEAFQLWPATCFTPSPFLPSFDLMPRPFVDSVVDRDNGLHVRGLRVE